MADVVVNIKANTDDIEKKLDKVTKKYEEVNMLSDAGNKDLVASQETFKESGAFDYMNDSFSQVRSVLSEIGNISSSIPRNLQNAMSTLVNGTRQSIGTLIKDMKTAGTVFSDFDDILNPQTVSNSIKFSAASIKQYAIDMKDAISVVNSMHTGTRERLNQNIKQITSAVSPAIKDITFKGHRRLTDDALVSTMLNGNNEYSHIPSMLKSMGFASPTAQRQALTFAVKTSPERYYRSTANNEYLNANLTATGSPVTATEAVPKNYRAAYLSGGRYINEKATPTVTGTNTDAQRAIYYSGIRDEISKGNHVAFEAAKKSGLVKIDKGRYQFADGVDDKMLDQFSAYVIQERLRAAQGSPEHFKSVKDSRNETTILGKDNNGIKESDRILRYDTRAVSNPYLTSNYKSTGSYTGESHRLPELKVPETINIPQMSVRMIDGKPTFTVKREKGYEPSLNFDWKKSGVEQTTSDEFITMGRNPVLDRLIRMHASEGARFENRSFGYGFSDNNTARTGLPLVISMPLDDFHDKDVYKNIKFKNNANGGQEAYFTGSSTELIDKLYSGELTPYLEYETVDAQGKKNKASVPYRAFAGSITGGGNIKFMPEADYNTMMSEDRDLRGIMPMLNYFNEIDKTNNRLVNPKTGMGFGLANNKKIEDDEAILGAYARFFDARNKLLSHSIPSEEFGIETPLAALVNFDAFYKARNIKKEKQFDGGAFLDPRVFNLKEDEFGTDFQGRMGPAKFAAQSFDWRKYMIDAGFAYDDKNHIPHFYMPGMSADSKDYEQFIKLQSDYLAGKMSTEQIKEFEAFRDSKFVDIMDARYGMLLPDTTLKSTAKMGSITPAMYNDIVKTVSSKGYRRPKALVDYNVGEAFTKNISSDSNRIKNGMVQLTPAEQTELMAMVSDPRYDFGLRFMKDTENYAGEKDFWAPAYMSSVQMTPTMLEKSAENYRKAFREMSTPEGIIRRMFSGNDLDSRRVQQNKELLYTDPNIQSSIRAEIKNLERKQLLGYGYFPDSAQMFLATANPDSVFGPMGQDQAGHAAQGYASKLKAKEREIIAGTAKSGIQSWTRSPYAAGANFFAAASARDEILKRYGMSGKSAMFNVEDFYTLNTGDFDGDFVWAYSDLSKDPEFIRRTEERNKLAQEIMKAREEQNNIIKEQEKAEGKVSPDLDYDPASFAQSVLRADNSIGPVGLGYKLGQAGRMTRLTKEDLAKIDAYSNITYANGIDSIKHIGLNNVQADSKVWEAIRTRKPVERLTKELLSEYDNNEFGKTDLFDYGLPTFFDPLGYSVLTNAAEGRSRNQDYGSEIRKAIDTNISNRYIGRRIEEQELAKWYGNLVGDKLTGVYQITDTKTLDEGRRRLAALNNIILDLEKTNKDSPELEDMKKLASHAESAIETESTFGFSEGNLDNISRFYEYMHWKNPVKTYGYKTRNQADLATYWQERALEERRERIPQEEESAVDQMLREAAGVVPGEKERNDAKLRRRAAHMFTGFNWSNAHEFTEGPIQLQGLHFAGLENGGYDYVDYKDAPKDPDIVYDKNGARLTIDYQHAADNGAAKANIARNILTGETKRRGRLDAHAIIGSAAHAYMDEYGRNRTTMSQEEAEKLAYQAYEDALLGPMVDGARKLSDEQIKEHKKAGVSFSQDKDGRILVAYDGEKKEQEALQEKLDKAWNDPFYSNSDPASSLINISRKFYERAFQNSNAEEHMIMSEGKQFRWDETEGRLKQLTSGTKEGGNGIWAIPMENGKPVLEGFKRYKANQKTGKIEEAEAGTYFTPDMIKKDKNGEITIVDWKSSLHGQKSAMAQMSFYARQLEEKGKQYYTTQDAGEKKDLEWFSQFVTQHDDGSFSSNIKRLQAVNLFSRGKDAVLTGEYGSQEWGKIVEPWLYGGMRNLVKAANKAFYQELPEAITPKFNGRHMNGSRSVIAPGEDEQLYFQSLEQADLLDEKLDKEQKEHISELFSGGTGVRDSQGKYIDQDKSYLVAKFMKDQEVLEGVKSFANKQSRRLNNFDYGRNDQYTQNIDQLTELFSGEQYDALQKYLSSDSAAADLDLFAAGLSKNQVEAAQTISKLQGLRQQYVENLPKTMEMDYRSIAYGEGDAISKLRSGRYKMQSDLSALRENEKLSRYYDEDNGFILDPAAYIGNIERAEGESDEDYTARQNKRLADAEKAAEEAAKEQQEFNNREEEINKAHAKFSDTVLAQIKKETADYINPLALLFKGKDLNETVASLEKDALRYEEEADLKAGPGKNAPKAYNADEQAALVAASKARKNAIERLKEIEGSALADLPNAQKEYEKAKLDARLNGTQIDSQAIRKLATERFMREYINANPTADNNTLNSAMANFQKMYDREQANQDELNSLRLMHQEAANRTRNENMLHQQELSQEQWRRQRMRQFSRSRITQSLYGLEDRQISQREAIRGYTQQNEGLYRRQSEIEKELETTTDSDRRKALESEQTRNAETINANVEAIRRANAEVEQLGTFGARAGAAFQTLSQSLGMVAQRLGRQLFQKALQETKRFVKEFDASMNEIQAITMKSNDEMRDVRSGTINRAIGLRTSVSNVATTEAALYRQGLSDTEVADRTESIIKFATVTKLNVAEATKIITTALQNDLVPSAEAAMDALVALGDSAATTAAEIGKGMQKAAASAKVAGVSYEELTALLTIGTSDTQLSGTQVGTALQTVFSRMRRLSLTGYTADQNGEKTTASDAEAALAAVGVNLWDNKTVGQMRSAYDVMLDLSKVWQNLSDAQKSIVTNAMAGTRQTNIFSTLMEGMSEDNGATLEKYLGLAEGSEGVTQSKYEIAMQSLAASMDTVRSSWDAVVESMVSGGSFTGILDGVSGFLQMFANAGGIAQGMSLVAGGITGIAVAIAALSSANPAIKALSTILGIAAGLAVGGGIAGLGSLFKTETEEERANREYSENYDWAKKRASDRSAEEGRQSSAIEKVRKLGRAYDEAAKSGDKLAESEAADKLTKGLYQLADAFPDVSKEILAAIQNLANWEQAVDSADKKGKEYIKQNGQATFNEYIDTIRTGGQTRYNQELAKLDSVTQAQDARKGLINAVNLANPGFKPLTNVSLTNGKKLDETLENGAINLAVARNSLNSAQGQRSLMDIFHIARKESSQFRDYSDSWLSTYHGSIKDDLLSNKDYGDRLNDYSQYVYDLFENIQTTSNKDQGEYERLARELSYNWAEEAISSMPLDLLAADSGIDQEKIATAINRQVMSVLRSDTNGTYINKDGTLNVDSLANYLDTEVKQKWVSGGSDFVKSLVKDNLTSSDYTYHVNTQDGFVGFDNLDEAREYVRNHGLDASDIKTKDNKNAVQTVNAQINAIRQQNNANNRQNTLDTILNGSGVSNAELLNQQILAGIIAERDRSDKYEVLDKVQRGEVSVSDLTEAELMKYNKNAKYLKPLTEYEDIDSMVKDYERIGLDGVLSSYIASNSNALIAYLNNDKEAFDVALQESVTGRQTPTGVMNAIFDSIVGSPEWAKRVRNDSDLSETYKLFQSIFGENADNILNAAEEGTYNDEANKNLRDYVNRTLSEKGIKVGTGRQFTGEQTASLAQQIISNYSSLAEAQRGMTTWTTDEWTAIQNKYPDLIRYLQMDDAQRASQEGQNLKRNIDIQFSVAGVEDLEEAGKVTSGLTQLLTDLQKNGEVKIKAQMELESGYNDRAQTLAKLINGTSAEKIDAMRSMGYTDQEIEEDFGGTLSKATSRQRALITGQGARNLDELYRIDPEEAERLATKYGYVRNTDSAFIGKLKGQGYRIDEQTGNVYNPNGQIDANATMQYNLNTKYRYRGSGIGVYRSNLLLGQERQATSTELAGYQRAFLDEEARNNLYRSNYSAYEQAYNSLGEEGRRLVAMQQENQAAAAANETARYTQDAIDAQRARAEAENRQYERDAIRQQLTNELSQSDNRYIRENAQQIVSARDIFTNGSFAEQLGLISGYSDTMRALQQAQYGLEGGNTAENRGYISSLLGLSDEQVDEMFQNGQEGELQTAINDKVKEFYQKLATELLPEELLTSLDFDTMSLDDIISSLDQVPEDLRELIEPFLKAINEAKDGVQGDNTYKSLSDVASSSLESTRKRGAAMSEVYDTLWGEGGEASFSERVSALEQNKNVDWGSIDNGLLYMVNSFGQEGSAITEDMINDAYYNALYGRKPSPETQRATMNSLFGGNMSGQNMIDTYRDWMQNQEQYAAEINAFNSLDHSDELANILKSEGVSANTAEKALRKYNEQVNEDKLKDVTQFSKGSANLASALSKIKKGGKDASEGTEMIRKNIEGFQDQMTAISKAQGKSGKQLDTKTLGFIDSLFPEISSDEIKQLSKDRLAELLEGAEDAVNEAATDDFQAIWDSMVDDLSLNYDLSNITVNPDGTLNLDALDDTARAAVEEAIARLEAYAGDLASLTFVQEEGKEKINLKALISKNANGKYHGRGGGGGGGGKSAADKLLEKQKFDVSAIQHDQKMLEIQEKNYDRYNDDAAYRDNINQQIQVQQRLADQYQKNIQEIENMRRSTKEGSDDWNKLTESLWAAQEAFASVAEAVDALYAKMDAQQKQLYEYNSTLLQHKQTMSEIDYTFYMNVNDPEAALGEIDKQLTGMNDIESEDRRRRAEIVSAMEDEYLRNGESDRYRDLVGERDSLTEKIAKSVNDRISLDATRLDVQKQYQQNEAIPYTHRLNMISSQMERADLNEDTESYNKLFEEQENIYKEIEERNNKHVTQLESLRDYYNSKGQTQNALNTTQEINSLLEQNDNMLTQRDKARKDKLEKEQNDTRESLQRQTMTEEHQNNGYALMANAYKRAGNHGAYRDMLQRQIANWRKMITVQKNLLAIEVAKLKAMEKETEEYYKQLQLVQEIEGKITELEANIANAEMDIMEDRVDEILEGIDRINDLSSHIQKLIKDQGQIYQNQGNWDAYFIMAEKRREELTSSVADMTAQAAQLKAEMGSVPYGSGPWDNLRQKVLSLEESISSARVELENFDRELEGIKVDRMLDEINRHEGNRTHNITLMQYEQTRYQTNGELTNYGIMLQKEIDYREENTAAMEEELTLLREELENINLSEKDYYRLSDAIKKKEEALLQNNNAIEKNNKLLRQNEQAIRKTRLELEQMVLKVIEDNKKKQRDMLNNTVEMQNIILNVIKRRYQDEWDLEKETLDRKKDALEKEKQLINERLNYRRQMMNAENKYSELNDYQRQLALISADPTRSKESKELTRKIDELRQDIRWDEASQQAEAATERIEDEINAINEYVQIHGENLQEMLLDANNFAAEVKEVLSGSYADIVLWLQQNDIDYQNSLDERKKQLEEGWKETWMAMKGIVETYWDEINEILSSQDSFMKFMYENSLDYANASVTGQLQLASQWQDGWTNAASAVSVALQAINYTPDIHEDFTPQNSEEAILEALGWDPDFSWYNNGSGYNPSFTSFDDHKNDGKEKGEEEDTKPDDTQPDQPTTEPTPAPSDYAGTEDVAQKNEEPVAPEPSAPPANTGTQQKQQASKSTYDVYDKNGFKTSYSVQASSKTEAQKIVEKEYGSSYSATTHTSTSAGVGGSNVATGVPPLNIDISKPFNDLSNAVGNVLGSFFEGISDLGAKAAEANKQNQEKLLTNKLITGPNAEGGLVDYTGLAWVDGSMYKPEAFLSAYDTANIKALTDALNYVNIEPFRVPNLDKINTSNQTIGDINITINGAEMKEDADFEDVARRVGQEFTKQLRKEGLNLASYTF